MPRARSKYRYGVYQIRNIYTDDLYIGSTAVRGFIKRFGDHRSKLDDQSHENQILQRVWNKYGENVFQFKILFYCDPENCLWYEQITMDHYQPKYNINPTAGSRLGAKLSQESKDKIRDANLGKKYSDEVNAKKGYSRIKSIEERQKISDSLKKHYISMQKRTAKLSICDVQEIKKLIQKGWRNKELAQRFHVKPHTISAIRHQKTWRNIYV